MDKNNDSSRMWDWKGENYCLQKDTNLDISEFLGDGVSQNEEDLSYMFGQTTPIKDCGDLAYSVTNTEYMNKESEYCRETSSQVKRRRMLQFDTDVLDAYLCNEDMPSTFLNSKGRDDSIEETFSDMSQWVSGFADTSTSCYKGLDQSSEGWLADCFNDAEMHFSPDDMNMCGASSDVQIDITELCNVPPEYEANIVPEHPTQTRRNVVFKGRKSYMQTPSKLAASVVYPFAFIKPCGAHGDVTLKDINQLIHTPPPSKLKQSKEGPASYPTSAFSGKPVVGKTKICTEGGKGSITIMRTKG
ncbi:protein XRI1-like isoform X3 [Cornus florida]|uniref:protein XRI1-like isoform X3 n=1 Tax=Cornus florida TaxID=4283 RepID=UPI0028A03286|nr:protein XRI1-like isoform X3 [Cornus florida]